MNQPSCSPVPGFSPAIISFCLGANKTWAILLILLPRLQIPKYQKAKKNQPTF
jgi:hypothetical protein